MRPFLSFLTLIVITSCLQAQDPGMQAAQQAQMATQIAVQNAQQANQQMLQASQTATQNAQLAQQQANQTAATSRCIAATPALSSKTGTYSSPVRVTIKASKGRKIYYTTDGWTPTIDSNPYSGPITVDATTTLQAIAISPCGNRSRVAEATYTLTGAPVHSLAVPPSTPGVVSNAAAAALASGKLLLAQGTPVPLTFASTVNSKTAHIGDKISLTLAEDLKLGDVVAVKKGTPSTAIITGVDTPRALGMPGEIYFRADSLQTDGTVVRLRGTAAKEGVDKVDKAATLMMIPVPIGLFIHGKDAEIKQGSLFTAYVEVDTPLPANQTTN